MKKDKLKKITIEKLKLIINDKLDHHNIKSIYNGFSNNKKNRLFGII